MYVSTLHDDLHVSLATSGASSVRQRPGARSERGADAREQYVAKRPIAAAADSRLCAHACLADALCRIPEVAHQSQFVCQPQRCLSRDRIAIAFVAEKAWRVLRVQPAWARDWTCLRR